MTRDEHVDRELERLFRLWALRAVPIGAIVFLLIAPLDFIGAPDVAGRFLAYRLAAAVGLLLIWYPASRTRSPLALRAWILAGVVLCAVTVEVLILTRGGSTSAYGYGMVLLAVTALGVIPASVRFHVAIAAAIYATFLVPLVIWGEATPFRDFFTLNYLFVATLAVSVFMRHLHRTSLRREIGLAFDLLEKERELGDEVAERTADLLRAAAEWRAAFDSTGDFMLLIDAAGRVVKVNRAVCALAGREPADLLGGPAAALLRSTDLDGALRPLEIEQRTARRASGEARHAPSGRWFLATAEPIAPGLEQAGGAILTLRDITDFKLLEQAVTDARDDWEETFDSIQEGITIHDASFNVLRANLAARRMIGCGDARCEGRKCFEIFHGLEAPIGGCPGCEAVRTGRPTTVDLYEPLLGRYLEIMAIPRSGGGVTHVVHDITERKLAMDELSRAAARLQDILTKAPFGVFVVGEDFRVESANPRMEGISGYPRAQFVGAFLGGFPGYAELGISLHVQGALEGVPFELGPAEYRCGDGRAVIGRFTGIPLDEDGKRKALVFVEDVTSLAAAEEERLRLNALLLQAQKMEAIGTLASGIAHDFNNILLAVIGLSDAAAERLPDGHPARQEIEAVIGAAERGSELVQQILAFGRKQELRMRAVDLRRLAVETRGLLVRVLPKNIAVEIRGGDTLPVFADPTQIGHVLMNLAVNARDAMPDGGLLTIEGAMVSIAGNDPGHPGVAPGCYAVIAFSDTGTGMSPEVCERIFDPFFTTKEQGKGTGLGLATAHGIVSQHGGALRVESRPGEGSTFFVYLPAAPRAAGAEAAAPPGGSEAILVVEDDDLTRHVIGRRLADLGYRVLEAPDGDEALRLLEGGRERPELLLCDVVIPGMSARDVAAAARARVPGMRIVFMSGHPESHLAQRGLLGRGELLLAKGLGPDEIARRLRAVLDGAVLQ